MKEIIVRGVRTHNLKNIDVNLPRDKLIVITGLSGSGKSSFAFDTLYAEGQRRYVESLSAYARQFLSIMEKPDLDSIEGLSPAISIQQKSTSHNPRSTVGTITEIYDYLRLLYARVGQARCPEHGEPLSLQTISQMVDRVLAYPPDTALMILAPIVTNRKGEFIQLFDRLRSQGFLRVRVDGVLYEIDEVPALDLRRNHSIDVIIDRFKVKPDLQQRLAESFETALRLAEGRATVAYKDLSTEETFSEKAACSQCGYSITELEPRLFSFNSPMGACPTCDGLGLKPFFDPKRVVQNPQLSLSKGAIRGWDQRSLYYFELLLSLSKHYNFSLDLPFANLPVKIQQALLYGSGKEEIKFTYFNEKGNKFHKLHAFEGVIPTMERRYRDTDSNIVREDLAKYLTPQICTECQGERLCLAARHVFVDGHSLPAIAKLAIDEAYTFFQTLTFQGQQGEIAERILKEIIARLGFLNNVGLNYLSLNRGADTLSGGEAQRIRLASQIGSGLVGVMYILDEPSIGLHQRDNERLLKTLFHLRDLGNTVIVVEHDEEAIRAADYVLDIGPGAGIHGGQIVAQGSPAEIAQTKGSLTGEYLAGTRAIKVPLQRSQPDPTRQLSLIGATGNNLKNVSIDIPVGLFTCVTGVSGSGKSTLINQTLYPIAASEINSATSLKPAPYQKIEGLEYFDKIVDINQSPIGRTPRSNPATYTGIFTAIRDIFTATSEARARGYKVGRFSFNVKGGRCEACQGDGTIKVEMHFLPDVYVTCDTCQGKRYNRETLDIQYKHKNIHEVLSMTVEAAREFFDAVPSIARKLQTLIEVGLTYIQLGQAATTLSGGEAQRVKLATELSKRDTGKTLYILDEPTTGLHFEDIALLLKILHHLRDEGNTIVVIEHNLDVIKTADWIIDMGPEGGSKGGEVLVYGTPETVAACERSYTGQFLKKVLT
jgi:excinuclease ABC subunit A